MIPKTEHDDSKPDNLPFRQVVEILVDIPYETLQKISPQSIRAKFFVKVPMVFTAMSAALLGSLYVVSVKLIGELCVLGQF